MRSYLEVVHGSQLGSEIEFRRRTLWIAGSLSLFIALVALLAGPGFLEVENLINILNQTAIISVMSVAVTFVLCANEIDLSVGAIAGLGSVVAALLIQLVGAPAGVIAAVGTGAAIGIINGTLATRLRIPSFLVTLAMAGIIKGCAMWISQTASIPVLSSFYIDVFSGGSIGPVPVLLLWTAAFATAGHYLLKKTPFGRRVVATGGQRDAAEYNGIDTSRIRTQVLALSGATAAFAGVLYAARLQSGRFQLGEGDELSVIASVALGGNSLFGGNGTVVGAIAGSMAIGIVNNGLTLIGLNYSQQLIVRGMIIVIAVAMSNQKKEPASRATVAQTIT